MNESVNLRDHSARTQAISEHHQSVFIDAGAGTGKTETIVTRIVTQLVGQEDFTMEQVAAITFTEKAGAELRNRFRRILVEHMASAQPEIKLKLEAAFGFVDSAAIGTIHSFCKRILSDNSIAAKLPVGFQIGSETSGPRLRIERARRVADVAWESLNSSEQSVLRRATVDAKKMQAIVEELDKRFAIVNELSVPDSLKEEKGFEGATYKFIFEAIAQLRVEQITRTQGGEIEFDDLLILTRNLLKNDNDLRQAVSDKYRVMIIDEFQDTDPVQWEIIRLITAEKGKVEQPKLGSLVLVGDPKQSIYRFRNADLNTFIEVKSNFATTENSRDEKFGVVRDLSSNFRSVRPVIEFVNWLFQDFVDGNISPLHMGVDYKGLDAVHDPKDAQPGPAVRIIQSPDEKTTKITRQEFDWTSQEIVRAIANGYKVTQRVGKSKREYREQAATFADVAILIPVRTHIEDLIRSLANHNIPFSSADPGILFSRPLVSGLVNAIKVVAQTDDDMALWATLKSPLFGLTDTQLFTFINFPKATWDIDGGATGNEDNVARALESLYEIRNEAGKVRPSEVIRQLVSKQQLFEKLAADSNGIFEASAIRMLLSHAVNWENQGNYGLLEYLDTLSILIDDKVKTLLPIPDDLDRNAVQIMTIHAAKGLEFPITVVTGLSSPPSTMPDRLLISRKGDIQFYLGKDKDENPIQSSGYSDLRDGEIALESSQESNRLLYVAMTRARDHLILSAVANKGEKKSKAVAIKDSLAHLPKPAIPLFEWNEPEDQEQPPHELALTNIEFDDAEPNFEKQVQASKIRHVVSPSSKAGIGMNVLARAKVEDFSNEDSSGLTELENDDWATAARISMTARDGRPFGRALHGVMDLVIKHGKVPEDEVLQGFIWSQAQTENVLKDLPELTHKVKLLMTCPIILEALEAEDSWPELHLAISDPNDEVKLAEGFADLVYRNSTGYVLVDYKTDREIGIEQMMHYQQQLGAYSLILEHLTGEPPVRILLLHVTSDSVEVINLYTP
jgi:ATP-dependent helicase/nuclease subunit A